MRSTRSIIIDDDLWKKIKFKVIEMNTTISQYIADCVEKDLEIDKE